MEIEHRERCYVCYRPRAHCFCDSIPSIDNRTQLLILQHRRERFHAFNTARIVRHALKQARVIVGYPHEMTDLNLGPSTGLLFPSDDAECLSELAPQRRPKQLVIVDGTWHHAKAILRDVPALRSLPRYCLRPDAPGRYRIRKEPTDESLSTLEATVEALRALEPETKGLAQLTDAFNQMVERQLAHPKVRHDRKKRLRGTIAERIPAVLGNLNRIVVAYGEAEEGEVGGGKRAAAPIYWLAKRLSDPASSFAATLQSNRPLSDKFLRHIQLDREFFRAAKTHEQFRAEWKAFLREDDVVVVFNRGTARSIAQIDPSFRPSILLRSVRYSPCRHLSPNLDTLIHHHGLRPAIGASNSRAAQRLENAIAFTYFLSSLLRAPRDERGWPSVVKG